MKKNLYGLVMCGGQSSRMGRDKGLITFSDTTWAHNTAELLAATPVKDVFISINTSQLNSYNFPADKLVVDLELANGPINGLLSAHQSHPQKDFFILACDMQLMTVETLLPLFSTYEKHHLHCDAFVYKNEGEIEPMCGIYTRNALEKTMEKVKKGELKKNSLKYLLENVNTYYLETSSEDSFENFNTEADIIQFS